MSNTENAPKPTPLDDRIMPGFVEITIPAEGLPATGKMLEIWRKFKPDLNN